jgi:two-component system, cell cycle sensor histidine kinase and response regulator CckA
MHNLNGGQIMPDSPDQSPDVARYRAQRKALIELAAEEPGARGDLDLALRRVTRIAARTLDVDRVSIWLYNADRSALECRTISDRNDPDVAAGICLNRNDYPSYFNALSEFAVIAAHDAHTDPRTAEFSANYLTPLGIRSMLDASVHVKGDVVGVLCHEHVGSERQWTEDEKTFSVALASIVSLAFAAAEGERHQAEMSEQRDLLNRAHQRLSSHLQNSPLVVIEWDSEFRVLRWPDRAERLFGWTAAEVLHRRPTEWAFVHENDRDVVAAGMRDLLSGTPRNMINGRNITSTGDVVHCEWYNSVLLDDAGAVVSVLSLVHDVTERVRAEAQQRASDERLLQAQRIETVGRLAGGIAHDFNNLLTVINGTAELALSLHRPAQALETDLQQIRGAGERAAALTRQLLAYSRKQIMVADVIDPGALIHDLSGIIFRLMGAHLEVVIDAHPEAGHVLVDAGQLEQVLLNLAVNSRDAMPDGGTLTMATRHVHYTSDDADRPAELRPGSWVLITVRDTGVGMDEATRSRVFEPFFTTKGPDRGTGLGLAVVHGIVMQSGGAIWVDSAPGAGTTVSVCLPRVAAPATVPAETVEIGFGTGSERILVVEDEPALRQLAQRILVRAGYTVECAGDGAEALRIMDARDGRFDLVFTDIVMPGMNGRDLAARLTDQYPGVKVLFTSGYTEDEILRLGIMDHATSFLAKPYGLQSLSASVRAVLAGVPA